MEKVTNYICTQKQGKNQGNSYAASLTKFSQLWQPYASKHLIYVFLIFWVPLSLIMIVLSRYCPKYEMERLLLHGIQFHFNAPSYTDMLSHIPVKPNLISHYHNSCLFFTPCQCNSDTKLYLYFSNNILAAMMSLYIW